MQRFVRSATAVLATALLVLSVLAGPASAQATEISIIEFAYEPYDAVVEAAVCRLSPVVNAAGTTVLGV